MSATNKKKVIEKYEDNAVVTVGILKSVLDATLNAVLDTKLNTILDTKLNTILDTKLNTIFDTKLNIILDTKLNAKLNEQMLEYQRYLGALSEEFHGRIDAMGEGISMLLEMYSRHGEENEKEHAIFRAKLLRLEAKVF